jgi:hypothetical protein
MKIFEQNRVEALAGAETFDFLTVRRDVRDDMQIFKSWVKYFKELDVPFIVRKRDRKTVQLWKILHVK